MMLRTGRAAVQELLLRRKWPLGPVVADLSEAVDWIAADGERVGSGQKQEVRYTRARPSCWPPARERGCDPSRWTAPSPCWSTRLSC